MGKAQKPIELPSGRLWPNTPSGAPLAIEVFGATGEYMSGKTLLGLSIAPGSHPEGHPFAGKPRTLLLDFEKSAGTYGGTGCCRIDVPAKMQEAFGQKQYQPIDVFNWFVDLVGKVQPGQFDVVMADPITDIESGQVDFIRRNAKSYGLSAGQVEKGGGLLWGAVKDDWKARLLKIGAKCQTFFFTSHLRQVWQGGSPVIGKKEPKGKETLMELASLYLWLERRAGKEGNVPDRPSAIVLKQRLADTLINAAGELEIRELMPAYLSVATVQVIRAYIANPPDPKHPKPYERVPVEEFSAEEAARLALATAESEKEVVQGKLALLARQQELRELARQEAAEKPQPPDQTGKMKADKAAAEDAEATRAKVEADAALAAQTAEGERLMADNDGLNKPPARERPSEGQIARVAELGKLLNLSKEAFREQFLSKAHVVKTSDLNRGQCELLIMALERELDRRKKLIMALERELDRRKNSPAGPGSSTP